MQQAVIATDMTGAVIYWNAFAERLFGWTAAEALGRSIVELTPTDDSRADAQAIMARLMDGLSWSGEFEVQRKDGSRFVAFVVNSPIVDSSGELTGIVGISTDVSAQRELESRLRQAAKMEAIGRLAGGVAHDFNNLLTIILGQLHAVAEESTISPEGKESLEVMKSAADRAAELTRQLLAFSRQQQLRPQIIEVGEAVRRTLPMLRRLITQAVVMEVELPEKPLWTVMDPVQFDQILLNLTVNARDAMPEGGVVRIVLASAASPSVGVTLPPVELSISDTGVGMAPEEVRRVFEPFFTTKESGRGTGLGLSTVYGIVEQAGGRIDVESVLGKGTQFRIQLPQSPQSLARTA